MAAAVSGVVVLEPLAAMRREPKVEREVLATLVWLRDAVPPVHWQKEHVARMEDGAIADEPGKGREAARVARRLEVGDEAVVVLCASDRIRVESKARAGREEQDLLTPAELCASNGASNISKRRASATTSSKTKVSSTMSMGSSTLSNP